MTQVGNINNDGLFQLAAQLSANGTVSSSGQPNDLLIQGDVYDSTWTNLLYSGTLLTGKVAGYTPEYAQGTTGIVGYAFLINLTGGLLQNAYDADSNMVEVQLFGNQSNANVYSLVSVPEPSVAIGLCTSLVGLGLIYLRQHKAEHVLAA